jgi:hypothetical protein
VSVDMIVTIRAVWCACELLRSNTAPCVTTRRRSAFNLRGQASVIVTRRSHCNLPSIQFKNRR